MLTIFPVLVRTQITITPLPQQNGYIYMKTETQFEATKIIIVGHPIYETDLTNMVSTSYSILYKIDGDDSSVVIKYSFQSLEHSEAEVKTLFSSIQQKRGILNFVGTIRKWLEGTFDNEDRELFQRNFGTIESNEEKLRVNENTILRSANTLRSEINIITNSINEDHGILNNFHNIYPWPRRKLINFQS